MLKPLLSNFSIKAFSGQTASMERESQQAVLTHFIKPFLSKNDSSGKSRPSAWFWSSLESMWWYNPANGFVSVFFADPGCVSFSGGSIEWLQANLGNFSGFATLQDLQALNSNFSSVRADCDCTFLLPHWNVWPMVLQLFDFLSIAFCRPIRCQRSLLLSWHSWHWAWQPPMTQTKSTLCWSDLRRAMLWKM